MNASTMATSSRVVAFPEAMHLLAAVTVHDGVQAAEKEGHLAGVNSWRYRVVTECRVVDAGEDEEHPIPRVHYGVSEAQGLRMKRFNLGRPLVDESEHCSPHFLGFLWRTRCVVDAVQSRRHG